MEPRMTLLLLSFLAFNTGTLSGLSLPASLTLVLLACCLPLVPGLLTLPSLALAAVRTWLASLPLRLLCTLVPAGHSRGLYRPELRWVPVVRRSLSAVVASPVVEAQWQVNERCARDSIAAGLARKAVKIGGVRRSGYFGLARLAVRRPSPVPAPAPARVSRKVATPATMTLSPGLPSAFALVLPSSPATRLVPRALPVRGAVRVAKRWSAGDLGGWFPTKTTTSLSSSPVVGFEPSLAPQPWVEDRDGDVRMEDAEWEVEMVDVGEVEESEVVGSGEVVREVVESEEVEMEDWAGEGVPTHPPQQHRDGDDDDDDDDVAGDLEKLDKLIDDEAAAEKSAPNQGDLMICKICGENPPNIIEDDVSGDVVCKSCGLVLGKTYMQ